MANVLGALLGGMLPMPQAVGPNVAGRGVDTRIVDSVRTAAQGLNAPINDWNVTVLSEPQWKEWQRTNPAANDTATTFSLLDAHRTYIRASKLNKPEDIEQHLAHELGHLVSNSHDEGVANRTKDQYFKTRTWSPVK